MTEARHDDHSLSRTLHPPPAPETRPFMIAACLAATFMTFLALEPWRGERRPAPVPSSSPPATSRLTPASASLLDPASVSQRIDALRRCRARAEERLVPLRTGLEEDRGSEHRDALKLALAEADEDVRLTHDLVRELEAAAPESAALELLGAPNARALALQWLALSRQCWLRQRLHLLALPPRADQEWTRASTGPEAASGAMVLALRRWFSAAEAQLRRPAAMPSTAGPELADLLEEVHAVACATYIVDWHATALPLVDQAEKAFLSGLSRLSGLTAPLIEKVVSDLWRWGHADGAIHGDASRVMFDTDREGTVRRLGELASFLAPPARERMQWLIARARADFSVEAPAQRGGRVTSR